MKIWMIRRKGCALRHANLAGVFIKCRPDSPVGAYGVDYCRAWLRLKDAKAYIREIDAEMYFEPFSLEATR